MASFVRIIHHVPDSAETMQRKLNIDNNVTSYSAAAVEALFTSIVDGAQVSYTKVATGVVQATATATFTGRPTADETLSLLNTTLTAKDSGANGTTQFNTSAVVATTATNLAACINANTTLNKQVSATSALGVVTITSLIPGVVGNGLQFSEALSNATISQFTSGSDGKQVAVNYGAAS